jgi:hypothetical protein
VSLEDASLDPEDQALLASLTPEGPIPGTPAYGTGGEPEGNDDEPGVAADTSAAPAAAPAAQAPAPSAAPSPAAATAPSAAPAPAAAPAATPAPAPAEPQGDPRAALRAARRNEKRLRDDLERANRELEELRAGKASTGQKSVVEMSEDELRELEENFPMQAQLVRTTRELQAKVDSLTKAPAQAGDDEWEPPAYQPQVQEVIDQVPQLQAWQFSKADQPKFHMAVQYDDSLRADPLWKTKPPQERFAEAVRRTQEAMGAQPSAHPTPARQDPAAVIAAAPATTAQGMGISDFRGGATADAPALDYRRMTDEDILASLKPTD